MKNKNKWAWLWLSILVIIGAGLAFGLLNSSEAKVKPAVEVRRTPIANTPTVRITLPTPTIVNNTTVVATRTISVPSVARLNNFSGRFFFIKANNLWQSSLNVNKPTTLTLNEVGGEAITNNGELAFVKSPALSPDGQTLVYAFSPEPIKQPNGDVIIKQDLIFMDVKSRAIKMTITDEKSDTFLDEPVWSADAKYLYFSNRATLRDEDNIVTGQKLGIERLELATNKREYLVQDGFQPAPSPDGKYLVFSGRAVSAQTFEPSLKVLDLDTRRVSYLMPPDNLFLNYVYPRVAPDGQWIVFCAPVGAVVPTPAPAPSTPSVVSSPIVSRLSYSVPTYMRPLLHGIPHELWLIRPDGTGLRKLTSIAEDQISTQWSKDSRYIHALGGHGFYIVEVATGEISMVGSFGSYSGFDFRAN